MELLPVSAREKAARESCGTQIPLFSIAPARKRARFDALTLIASPVPGFSKRLLTILPQDG
jgi:hypothetical protein